MPNNFMPNNNFNIIPNNNVNKKSIEFNKNSQDDNKNNESKHVNNNNNKDEKFEYNSNINNEAKISNDTNDKKNVDNMELEKEEIFIEDHSQNNKDNKKDEEEEKKEQNNSNNKKDDTEELKDKKINSNIYNNEMNYGEESVTEITNEEYNKQILESIGLIQKALEENSIDFKFLMNDVCGKKNVNGKVYEYINIEDFNDKVYSLGINLTDLQLSCLCSKFCVPGDLRLIDEKKFEGCLGDNSNVLEKDE